MTSQLKLFINKRVIMLCYKLCMRCCDTENCNFDHLHPNDLEDGFANKLVNKLSPEVFTAMISSGNIGRGSGGRGGRRGGERDSGGCGRGSVNNNKRNYSQRCGANR